MPDKHMYLLLKLDDAGTIWGETQLQSMLNDRPTMSHHIQQGDYLWQWCCSRFANTGATNRILWDNQQPAVRADHSPWTKFKNGRIRVSKTHINGPRKGLEQNFEEAWSCVAFEFHNIDNSDLFVQLSELAQKGQISRKNYIKAIFAVELIAVQETRAFYVESFLPYLADKGDSK